MHFFKLVSACAAVVAAAGANAAVIGTLGGGAGPFLSLSSAQSCSAATPCTLGPGVATVVGGSTYASDLVFADMPAGAVFQNRFLAAGTTPGPQSLMSFAGAGASYVSFLWGSPDTYNQLTVTSNLGTYQFNPMNLAFPVSDGNQSFSQYVQFQAGAGENITSMLFTSFADSFEVTNFTVLTRAVPEPSMLALLLTGAGILAVMGRRRSRAALRA